MKHKKIKAESPEDGEHYCLCDETVLYEPELKKLYRVKPPKWHDCEYIRRVGARVFGNALVADKAIEGMPDVGKDKTVRENAEISENRNRIWQNTFSRHMDFDRNLILKEMDQEAKQRRTEELRIATLIAEAQNGKELEH